MNPQGGGLVPVAVSTELIGVTLEYPVPAVARPGGVVSADGIVTLARVAEDVGFGAIAFTEHPAPSQKWLDSGGHGSLDVSAALGFAAAVTSRITLMSHASILPFHNPYAAAKAFSTLDILSNGRLVIVVGAGYLRSEFVAMGSPFEERRQVLDEALEVVRECWTGTPVTREGRFRGLGVVSSPSPLQRGGPTILVGGNSRDARARAARQDGWSPLMVSEPTARTVRTRALSTVSELAAGINEVRELAEASGRPRPQVQVQPTGRRFPIDGGTTEGQSVAQHEEELSALEELGVDRIVVQIPGDSIARAEDALRSYASAFLSRGTAETQNTK